jgi:hypothetical protein
MMNQNQKENLLEEIRKLRIDLEELKEYVYSDFCQQCLDMKEKIKQYENKISVLQSLLTKLD